MNPEKYSSIKMNLDDPQRKQKGKEDLRRVYWIDVTCAPGCGVLFINVPTELTPMLRL